MVLKMVAVLIATATFYINTAKRCYKKKIVERTLLFIGLLIYKTESNDCMSIPISI